MLKKRKQEQRIMPQQSPDMEALPATTQLGTVDVKGSSITKKLAQLTTEEDRAREGAGFLSLHRQERSGRRPIGMGEHPERIPPAQGFRQRKAVIGMNAPGLFTGAVYGVRGEYPVCARFNRFTSGQMRGSPCPRGFAM